MKNSFFVIAIMLFISCVCNAQDQEPKYVYCEIVGTGTLLGKVTIDVDFGQKLNIWATNKLKDENGKNIKFGSMIDALNFMGKRGWEFTQAYAVSNGGNGSVYHYLMKKPFADLDAESKAEFNKN